MARKYTSWGWRNEDAGISSHWGITIAHDTPVTGVIQTNTIEHICDEIFGSDAIDLTWETWLADFESENGREPTDEEKEEASMGMDETTHLIGDWRKNDDGLYEHVTDGETGYAAIVGSPYTQVVFSKTIARAALCSPCFPGQADIGSDGEYLAYTLPADLMGDSS